MTPRSFELRIDEIVLHGFAAVDTTLLAATLEQRLARLLREAPPVLAARRVTLLNAPPIEVEAEAGAEQIADALARSLYALLAGNSAGAGGVA